MFAEVPLLAHRALVDAVHFGDHGLRQCGFALSESCLAAPGRAVTAPARRRKEEATDGAGYRRVIVAHGAHAATTSLLSWAGAPTRWCRAATNFGICL